MKSSGMPFPKFSHSMLSMMKFLKQRYDMASGHASHRRRYIKDERLKSKAAKAINPANDYQSGPAPSNKSGNTSHAGSR